MRVEQGNLAGALVLIVAGDCFARRGGEPPQTLSLPDLALRLGKVGRPSKTEGGLNLVSSLFAEIGQFLAHEGGESLFVVGMPARQRGPIENDVEGIP